jgi:F-type H+-transporting ATPase subunit a
MDFIEILQHHLLDRPLAHLFSVGGHPVDLTLHGLMMLIVVVGLIVLMALAQRQSGGAATGLGNLVEVFIVYVRDEIVRPNLGEEAGDNYLPYFLTLFFFILGCNLLGLVPWGATATGNISVTAALALMTYFMIHFSGVRQHGAVHYLQTYIPHGIPVWLAPLMFFIEFVIGPTTKAFALCIRLFANMIAGHIVILAFLCMIFIFKSIFIAPVSIVAAVGLGMLELFVAFLQAYVFTLLTAVFVGSSVNPQH